jgi:hypothetical protein
MGLTITSGAVMMKGSLLAGDLTIACLCSSLLMTWLKYSLAVFEL